MGTASRRRPVSLSPSSVADLSTAADERRCPCSPDDGDGDAAADDFEFTPLLPRQRRGSVCECPRTACLGGGTDQAALAALTHPPPQWRERAAPARRAPQQQVRRVRWHEMAFGSVRVPAAMDMGEIRRRLQAAPPPRKTTDEPAAGWAPWRLIRSLSCKGVEAVAGEARVGERWRRPAGELRCACMAASRG